MFQYDAQVLTVIDGDTLKIDLDLGLHVHIHATVRLMGLNAPEKSTPEGKAALAFVTALVARLGPAVRVETVKDRAEKYGRFLAWISWPGTTELSLNQQLLSSGNAKPYDGHGVRPI